MDNYNFTSESNQHNQLDPEANEKALKFSNHEIKKI